MEEGQAERIVREDGGRLPAWARGPPPSEIVVRLPAPHAVLCVSGVWSSFGLVELPNARGAPSALTIDWRLLGISRANLPVAAVTSPEHLEDSFGPEMALGIADHLRKAFAEQPADVERVVQWVSALQCYYDDVCAFGVLKNVREIFGKVACVTDVATRTPYKTLFLIQALMYCAALRHDGDFKDNLTLALRLCLPAVVYNTVSAFMDDAMQQFPSKSTMSRWRLVVDVALMLQRRQRNSGAPSRVRYLMVDSSVQHGRDYLLVIYSEIDLDDIPHLISIADRMVHLWTHR
jgi:hypothetical protein